MRKLLGRITSSLDFWPVIVIIFFGILASRHLFTQGYFNMHDDLQMMRQLEMEKCFKDGQIPCRWVPDMGYGYGFPLFNYYPPLPYLIGQIIRFFGFSFVDTVKITFALSIIVSGITMFSLARVFWGRAGGVLSAIFYIWAPYHAVDVYVRGAMNEAWALAWFPLILFFSYKLIAESLIHKTTRDRTYLIVGLAISWALLMLSHNLMVLIFTPVFAGWCLIFLFQKRSWREIPRLILSGILAFGLAAFFTLPTVFELKYIQVNLLASGYYEYFAHFANIRQLLINRFWGYGPSIWGDKDGMSFQIGHLHWLLSLVVFGLTIHRLIKSRRFDHRLITLNFFFTVGWVTAFMVHSRSTPIWQALDPLKYVQFPWRFLTLTTLSFSFIAGSVLLFLKSRKLLVSLLLISLLLFLNWKYFRPENGRLGPLTDEQKFAGAAWNLQQSAGILDYLPVWSEQAPKSPAKYPAEYLGDHGNLTGVKSGTNWVKFQVNGLGGVVRLNTFYFPNWRVFVDGKQVLTYTADDKLGRIHFTVRPGVHEVQAQLFDTQIRKVGNIISFFSTFLLIIFLFRRDRK